MEMIQGLSAAFLVVTSIIEKMPENNATRQAHIDIRQAMYQVDMTQVKQLAERTHEMTSEKPQIEKPRTFTLNIRSSLTVLQPNACKCSRIPLQ